MIDIEIEKTRPNADEIEITTIGAGASAGESVVVHLTDNRWMIIDSCVLDGEVLPLYYLRKREVDPLKVVYIVCTHWHKDHIQGLSTLLSECKNARLALPSVFNQDSVFKAVFTEEKSKYSPIAKELGACLDILDSRTDDVLRRPKYLNADKEVCSYTINGIGVVVNSLSPSDVMKEKYDKMLVNSTLQQMADNDMDTNMCSVVLNIFVEDERLNILLGADLECNRSDEKAIGCSGCCKANSAIGWCNIIIDSEKYKRHHIYHYLKSSHHSSMNGYCPSLMDNKIKKDETIITTTLFENNANVRLPQDDMLSQYLSKCENYYITSDRPKPKKIKDGKSDIENQRHKTVESIKVETPRCGIITTRYNVSNGKMISHELLGSARLVDSELISAYKI